MRGVILEVETEVEVETVCDFSGVWRTFDALACEVDGDGAARTGLGVMGVATVEGEATEEEFAAIIGIVSFTGVTGWVGMGVEI